ncbi:MAG TPA: YtcA family lipoprotein [Myxococcaceae bacterium]|nr:YtcA family lipoprotein [Myxococcaceae bacterium]
MNVRRRPLPGSGLLLLGGLAGCDPTLNLWGSVLPAWVMCLGLGAVLAGLLRWLFARTGLERHLGPLVLVYPSLVLLLTCLLWIVLFRG